MPLECFKKIVPKKHMPAEFSQKTIDTIERIESNPDVIGVMYIVGETTKMCTLPETMAQALGLALPRLNKAVHNAITEIDITDEPLAFRLETHTMEVMVATDTDFTACTLQRHERRRRRERKRTFWSK